MLKKNWKSLLVLLLLVALIVYSIVSLGAIPAEPLLEDYSGEEAYYAALEEYDAVRRHTHALITIGVLLVSAVGFALEAAPVTVVAMTIPIFFAFSGILSVKEAFSGFADSTVVLFASMFILGEAMFRTGLAKKVGLFVVKVFSGSETKLWFGVMLVTAVMSMFLSNTGTVAVLLPVCIGIADSQGWNRAKLLLPMALMSSVGGMGTMVGTPPNLTVNAVLDTYGYEQLGFFDYAAFGIPVAVISFIYFLLIGNKLIPNRPSLDTSSKYTQDDTPNPKKQLIAGLILVAVIIMMAADIIDLTLVAATGALVAVLTGCLTEKHAYRAIDWTTIFLFAGALSLSNAMSQTGAGSIIADLCIAATGGSPSPMVLFAVLYIVCGTLTQFMSNTASAALLCPIGLEIAVALGVSPYTVVLALGFSASCAFITPIATPPNALVSGPGSLRFMDYVKVGGPLYILVFIVALILIPIIWPFALV